MFFLSTLSLTCFSIIAPQSQPLTITPIYNSRCKCFWFIPRILSAAAPRFCFSLRCQKKFCCWLFFLILYIVSVFLFSNCILLKNEIGYRLVLTSHCNIFEQGHAKRSAASSYRWWLIIQLTSAVHYGGVGRLYCNSKISFGNSSTRTCVRNLPI